MNEFKDYFENQSSAVRMVVGNKLDDAAGKREILGSSAQRWAIKHDSFHIECSAKTLFGIEMIFDYMADEIFKKREIWDSNNGSVPLNENPIPKRFKCACK